MNALYIITIHKISFENKKLIKNKYPVLMQHGLVQESANWVLNGPSNKSIALGLAESGYEVWLGNFRGNVHGKAHETLDIESEEFWGFSIDDYARYNVFF